MLVQLLATLCLPALPGCLNVPTISLERGMNVHARQSRISKSVPTSYLLQRRLLHGQELLPRNILSHATRREANDVKHSKQTVSVCD